MCLLLLLASIIFILSQSQGVGKQLPPTSLVHWCRKRVRRSGWEGEKVGEENDCNPHSTCQCRTILYPKQQRMSSKTQRL